MKENQGRESAGEGKTRLTGMTEKRNGSLALKRRGERRLV